MVASAFRSVNFLGGSVSFSKSARNWETRSVRFWIGELFGWIGELFGWIGELFIGKALTEQAASRHRVLWALWGSRTQRPEPFNDRCRGTKGKGAAKLSKDSPDSRSCSTAFCEEYGAGIRFLRISCSMHGFPHRILLRRGTYVEKD